MTATDTRDVPRANVTLILEGTYPYVAGGVSSWVHQLLRAYPRRSFALLHISPRPGVYPRPLYELPDNVTVLEEAHCMARAPRRPQRSRWRRSANARAQPSRVLAAIRRLHVEDTVDDELIDDLAADDLSVAEFLHGDATFALLRDELYERLSPGAPFIDFFWHFRAMHVPLLRLLATDCPPADVYHAVSAGYAGLVGALASWRTARPLLVTEHGIYARERELELSRATWIRDVDAGEPDLARPSPLRRFWSHYFKMLSRIAYHRATLLLTLSTTNRTKQLADGADPRKTAIVPNGVDQQQFRPAREPRRDRTRRTLRVGFVGRVVPIKDVATLIRACALALGDVSLETWIVGPEDEDRPYARRCHALVDAMNLGGHIHFLGPRPAAQIYPQIDVLVLTSISEGQPLVILEAYASAVPVIATDVGACRELIEGAGAHDRRLGHSGIVTRVANPAETAAALTYMADAPDARVAMGRVGLARVAARYQQRHVEARYDSLYSALVTSWPESVGNSND